MITPKNFNTILGLLSAPHSRLATSVCHLALVLFGFMKDPSGPHIYSLDDFSRIIKHFPWLDVLMFIDVAFETLDHFQIFNTKISTLKVVTSFFTSERQLFQLVCLFPAVKDLECNFCKCSFPPSPGPTAFEIPITLQTLHVDHNGLEMLMASGEKRLYSGLENLDLQDISFNDSESVAELLRLAGDTLIRLQISCNEGIYDRNTDGTSE